MVLNRKLYVDFTTIAQLSFDMFGCVVASNAALAKGYKMMYPLHNLPAASIANGDPASRKDKFLFLMSLCAL